MDFDKLKELTDQEIISFMNGENIEGMSDEGIIGEIKQYFLSGRKDFTVSPKINEVEKYILTIVYDRWVKIVKTS